MSDREEDRRWICWEGDGHKWVVTAKSWGHTTETCSVCGEFVFSDNVDVMATVYAAIFLVVFLLAMWLVVRFR